MRKKKIHFVSLSNFEKGLFRHRWGMGPLLTASFQAVWYERHFRVFIKVIKDVWEEKVRENKPILFSSSMLSIFTD